MLKCCLQTNTIMWLMLLSFCQNVYAKETLTLAVHPFLSPVEIEKRFTPLVNYLSLQSGFNIILKIGSNYEEHIEYIGTDKVDIAYMGPVSYVKLVNLYGLKPILAKLEVNGQSFFQGVFIVRKDSNIKSLAELKKKRIALGNTNSTMSFIVPHYQLHQTGIINDKIIVNQPLATHEDIALAVLSGDFDVGAVKPAVFKSYQAYGLRLLAKTPKISEHLFVTSSKLPQKQIQILREILINMKNSNDGLAVLQGIKKDISALVPATDSDYTNLKAIISAEEYLHSH
ncbi:MAG: phosphate/phosphite/phosphonate ABC transporter substrate-binding protein [Proteobacteria bacterium]|nr:phosphate/phosphite/phosphonate ABC transporter substrate-binding protein [Pseudomonadota bacterium]